MSTEPNTTPANTAATAQAPAASSVALGLAIDHPARPDDRDRGKVSLGYEGFRMPFWVILPWIGFLAWGVSYLVLYLLPNIAPPAAQ